MPESDSSLTKTRSSADARILRAAGVFWFLVALAGQWVFAYYIIFHYGLPLAAKGFPGFAETYLKDSYIPGGLAANMAIAAHVLFAVIIHGLGPLQFIPQIRNNFPKFHHFVGRAFLVAATIASLSGLYIVWVRGTDEGWLADTTNTLIAVCVFFFGAMALRHAMAREIDTHRRWALRLFLAANAVWFIRVALFATGFPLMLAGISFEAYADQIIAAVHMTKLLVPLALLELYFWAQKSSSIRTRIVVAFMIIAATLFAGLGIFGISMAVWLPGAQGVMMEF